MKVFITEFDLFNVIGGGQTVYRRLVETCPEINFYYLTTAEPMDLKRPANTHPIPYQVIYHLDKLSLSLRDIPPPNWTYPDFVLASNIAASIANQQFDVIDMPDYQRFGYFLRDALYQHRVHFDKIVLAMHGNMSTTMRYNFNQQRLDYDLAEQWQYRSADIRYAISKSYIEEWHCISEFKTYYLNPLRFISLPTPVTAPTKEQAPCLNYIGRTERRKGPDAFVNLVSWLPSTSYSSANIIGPDDGTHTLIRSMAGNRGVDIRFLGPKTHAELAAIFAQRSITVLPSRYDTLNLLAIESLLAGCPTAIGSGAGVCQFLNEYYPSVPFVTIDMNNIYDCLPQLREILDSYERYRDLLVKTINQSNPIIDGLDLFSIYNSQSNRDTSLTAMHEDWYNQLLRIYSAESASPTKLSHKSISQLSSNNPQIMEEYKKTQLLWNHYKEVQRLPEINDIEIAHKIKIYWELSQNHRVDRVRIWNEIGRLERIRGNHLIAATYYLRVMRALGGDKFGVLPFVVSTLNAHNFPQESKTASAMYGEQNNVLSSQELLIQALENNRHYASRSFDMIDDRRDCAAYRVSIIVSLYNAALKLPLFLKMLQSQSLIQNGQAELIFVETGSSMPDYEAFIKLISEMEFKFQVVYARTVERETIQSAWNRGILLSRAPYLTFLGVDEAIVPDCLEVLANELDTELTVDWVIGNSLVTEVDTVGNWLNDIMYYNRTGYKQDLVYLETCYLSWVGALYRRSIHDRFGFYDPSFNAAGDTEFKSRVLPYIKSKAIPKLLGIFLNYPDDRTTASPTAEIEDLRAWYLHRTLAGIRYAFAQRDPREAYTLIRDAVKYRKSYLNHESSDIEYAYNLALFLKGKMPLDGLHKLIDDIKSILDSYRTLDMLPNSTGHSAEFYLKATSELVIKMGPHIQIFNDNRYEQHYWVWRSDLKSAVKRSENRLIWR